MSCPWAGENRDAVLTALIRNRGEIRRQVTQGLTLKFSPELRFEIDETFDRLDATRPHVLSTRTCGAIWMTTTGMTTGVMAAMIRLFSPLVALLLALWPGAGRLAVTRCRGRICATPSAR